MAATQTLFSCIAEHMARSTVDMDNDPAFCVLLSSAYTPGTTTHVKLADVIANEIAAGNGYVANGVAVTVGVTRVGALTTITCTDPVWVATGGDIPAFRYGVVYINVTRNGVVNPLVSWILGDGTPADVPITVSGATLRLRVNAAGLYTT